jgi:hypothetical protein
MRMNVSIKREQSQIYLNFAEQEKRLMRMNYRFSFVKAKEKRGCPKNPAPHGILNLLERLLP